jgi:hypothetical protein
MGKAKTRKEISKKAALRVERTGTEEDWDAIQQAAILEAEAVKCTLPAYLEGLKAMQRALQERIQQVESEIQASEAEGLIDP